MQGAVTTYHVVVQPRDIQRWPIQCQHLQCVLCPYGVCHQPIGAVQLLTVQFMLVLSCIRVNLCNEKLAQSIGILVYIGNNGGFGFGGPVGLV